MIFEDQLFTKYVHLSPAIPEFLPWAAAILTIFYGLYIIRRHKNSSEEKDINLNEV